MAMNKGSVSIDASGNATGSGFAKAFYDDFVAKVPEIPAGAAGAQAKRQLADLANSFALVIDYIKNNAEVTVVVTTSDAALQTVGGVDTQAPAANRTLTQKGTVG